MWQRKAELDHVMHKCIVYFVDYSVKEKKKLFQQLNKIALKPVFHACMHYLYYISQCMTILRPIEQHGLKDTSPNDYGCGPTLCAYNYVQ